PHANPPAFQQGKEARTSVAPGGRGMNGLWRRLRDADISLWLLVLVFGTYLLTDLLWHKIDARPPRWDEAHYLTISQHCYQALRHGDLLTALSLKDVSNTKTLFVPLLSAVSYFVVGDSEKLATMLVNLVSMLLIFHCLLQMARDWAGHAGAGAVACWMFCTIPAVMVFSHYYQVDLPLTAAVCLTLRLCLALDGNDFRGTGRFVLLGAIVAAGTMTKHLY